MKLRHLILFCLAIAFAQPLLAGGKQRVYEEPFEKVWDACIRAANENFTVDYSDKESGTISFHSGISVTSSGFRVGVTISKLADHKTKVVLNPQKKAQLFAWGAGGRIAKKFYKQVDLLLEETEVEGKTGDRPGPGS